MPEKEKEKILFVMNPISGGVDKNVIEIEIAAYAKLHNFEYEIFHTTGKYDNESIRHWVDSIKPDKIVAVGGDGTLKTVAEVMLGKNIPIGIIPAGSANGMARELELPATVKDCLDIVMQGKPDHIDAICINDDDVCLHLSDIGMNAQLVKYFEDRALRGKFGYARGLIRMLWKRTLMQVTINNGHDKIRREAFMVVLANARMYGTGAMINPAGDLRDGIFEVIIIRRLTLIALMKMFFKRRNINSKYIEIIPAESVRISVKRKAYFQVDGEYKGKTRMIFAEMRKHSVYLLRK